MTTREQIIKRWETHIIPCVFRAEDKLRPRLQAILRQYRDDPTTALEMYCHAIAVEIASHTTDEEIAKLED